MRTKTIAIALLLLCSAAPARAVETDADATANRNVRVLLFSHHGPPAAEVFERLVPDARVRLLAIANDPAANAVLKDRALIALAGFGGDEVRAVYDRALADRSLKVTARVHVLSAYTRAFPERVDVVLEEARHHPDGAVRNSAETLIRSRQSAAPAHNR